MLLREKVDLLEHLSERTEEGRWWAAMELAEERIARGTEKRTHAAVEPDVATPEQWEEARALAALRQLHEIRDLVLMEVRQLVEYIHVDMGTSALRLGEVAGVSNGTTAKWVREPHFLGLRERDAEATPTDPEPPWAVLAELKGRDPVD